MSGDIRLGRLAGFSLAMNWSVLVVVWLVTASLGTFALPTAAPGYSVTAYWLAGLAAALLFVCCLLAHEVAHAAVARQVGVEVVGLTLWLFGGVATLRGQPRSPRDDLRIAGAGPLTSLLLAGAFAALTPVLDAFGAPRLGLAVTGWLAAINLMLGVFNLVPGAPLDGGRLLRAWLWHRHGDQVRAAASAARAGQTVGLVLIGLGMLQLLATGSVGGLWLAFIGWFIRSAAQAEEASVTTVHALAGLRVADVMSPHPEVLPDSLTIAELAAAPPGRAHSTYPVVDPDGHVTGLVSLSRLHAVPVDARRTTRLADVAMPSSELPTAAPDEELPTVLERLSAKTGGRLLVLELGQLVGILTTSDLARTASLRGLASGTVDRVRTG